ncbi:hypothetical protein SPLC1_S240050 [Arthrospira platensis C1]|nr:hypothetical protein SPLC1_S240050 [Arthrospira platensis C1]
MGMEGRSRFLIAIAQIPTLKLSYRLYLQYLIFFLAI